MVSTGEELGGGGAGGGGFLPQAASTVELMKYSMVGSCGCDCLCATSVWARPTSQRYAAIAPTEGMLAMITFTDYESICASDSSLGCQADRSVSRLCVACAPPPRTPRESGPDEAIRSV